MKELWVGTQQNREGGAEGGGKDSNSVYIHFYTNP